MTVAAEPLTCASGVSAGKLFIFHITHLSGCRDELPLLLVGVLLFKHVVYVHGPHNDPLTSPLAPSLGQRNNCNINSGSPLLFFRPAGLQYQYIMEASLKTPTWHDGWPLNHSEVLTDVLECSLCVQTVGSVCPALSVLTQISDSKQLLPKATSCCHQQNGPGRDKCQIGPRLSLLMQLRASRFVQEIHRHLASQLLLAAGAIVWFIVLINTVYNRHIEKEACCLQWRQKTIMSSLEWTFYTRYNQCANQMDFLFPWQD